MLRERKRGEGREREMMIKREGRERDENKEKGQRDEEERGEGVRVGGVFE